MLCKCYAHAHAERERDLAARGLIKSSLASLAYVRTPNGDGSLIVGDHNITLLQRTTSTW